MELRLLGFIDAIRAVGNNTIVSTDTVGVAQHSPH